MQEEPHYIEGPNGALAYRKIDGAGPCVVWLGGFRSDMLGTKAEYLSTWASINGRAYLRFDYSGHGESAGAFEDGCISDWTADAFAAVDALTDGPVILVGSSMGAWIATRVALARSDRLAGAVFIAPAPDFTERLMKPALSEDQIKTLGETGRIETPSDYADEPDVFTAKLLEDGARNLVMTGSIPIDAPVRIFQGMADADVPFRHALDFAEQLTGADVEVFLSKKGDHRLSTPEDLARLAAAIGSI